MRFTRHHVDPAGRSERPAAALSFVSGTSGFTFLVNNNSLTADQIRAAELQLAQQVAATR